jgi:hypothetical protein
MNLFPARLPDAPMRPDNSPQPTAECLVRRIPQLRNFLRRHGFGGVVIDRAIDRVIHAAIPYIRDDGTAKPCTFGNRVSWLFGSALKAARQEAAREPRCDLIDPSLLAAKVADEQSTAAVAAVWAALDQLTDPQRQAVYFCLMRGLTLAEAAVEMGCRPTTVLRHRDRGVQRLRRLLASLLTNPPPGAEAFVH